MTTEITPENKMHLEKIEQELRISGEALDQLWMKARNASGQERMDLHKQIGPLREKQRAGREQQELLKRS